MDFATTDIQAQLAEAARRYLSDRYPPDAVGELDEQAWPELRRQGWLDADLGLVERTLLAQESGRALHPTPWLVTAALAAPAYYAAGLDVPGPCTLADGSLGCRAERERGHWRVDGAVAAVPGAAHATELVVAARTATGVALFAVVPDAPGVSSTDLAGVDPLRPIADLTFAHSPARRLAGTSVLELIRRTSAVLFAAEGIGVADRALAMAVEHASSRVQFDRPIGSYQAISHRLADGYADLELARSLVYLAACEPADQAALACAVQASREAAVTVCESAIQVAGGMGVTWEYPLHHWYRRALWLDAWLGAEPDPLDTIAGVLFA